MANGGETLGPGMVEPVAKNDERWRRIRSKSHPEGRRFEPG